MNAPDLPVPFIPAEIDLRDREGFLLNVERIAASELVAMSSGAEFKAAFLLWCKAWQQVPAGSLPDNDRVLAAWSGAGEAWLELKAMALRGFVLCRDGRLYHRLLCERALDAWQEKQKEARKQAQGQIRLRRFRQREAASGNADETRFACVSAPSETADASPLCPPLSSPIPPSEHPPISPQPLLLEAGDMAEAMLRIWAEELPMLPQPRRLDAARRKALGRRLRDSFVTLDAWRRYCQRIRGSPFLTGENARGWRADLDFALKPRTISKTLEGGYDRTHPVKSKPGSTAGSKPARSPFELD